MAQSTSKYSWLAGLPKLIPKGDIGMKQVIGWMYVNSSLTTTESMEGSESAASLLFLSVPSDAVSDNDSLGERSGE
jgi:hypothetical protein